MNQTDGLLPDYLVSFKSLFESDDLFTLLQKLGVAILAGITSVDAIVLALAKLSGENLSERIAVAAILVATISNNIVKAAIAYFAGSEELRKNTLLELGVLVLVSVLYLVIFLII